MNRGPQEVTKDTLLTVLLESLADFAFTGIRTVVVVVIVGAVAVVVLARLVRMLPVS